MRESLIRYLATWKSLLLLVGAALIIAACSPADLAQDSDLVPTSTTRPTSTTTQVATTAVQSATTTSALPQSGGPIFGPKEVTIEWANCFETGGAQFGDLTFSCSAGRYPDIPEFHEGYFNGYVNFETNDQDDVIAVSIGASGYNGSCFWSREEGVEWAAPVENGEAVIQGVLFGTDSCDGFQFTFQATWDQETLGFSMDGAIEPVG